MNLTKFAENLNDLKSDKNLSRKELAEILQLDEASVCRYLQGTCEPTVTNIILLADYFNCSTDFLIGLENENSLTNFSECPPLGERLKRLVEKTGYSGYKFCKLCGLKDSNYYYWLSGKHEPSIDNIIKIAKYFNRSVDYVLGREN